MRRILLIGVALALLAAAAVGIWWYYHRDQHTNELLLYGNIDLRQVQLAFNSNERIAEVFVQEGDRVRKGQVVARLEVGRLQPQVAQAEAQAAAQREIVAKMHSGNRPEEKSQSHANVASAKADVVNARLHYDRMKKLAVVRLPDQSQASAVSKDELDNAKAALDVAEAKLTVNEKALDLMLKGWRSEEVAEAEARLRANEAQFAYLKQLLSDAQLVAPADAVVRTRLMEPGEISSPQKPVFSLAIIDPKWVRAYVAENHLGLVRHGMKAAVVVDTFPDRRFDGWVGFLSPVAEFTPKTVQTEELRTSLVYEVRVFVNDPSDELRLGMPATVHLPRPENLPAK
jgi:HlyD family secretion protein